jgi:hypothetical protein
VPVPLRGQRRRRLRLRREEQDVDVRAHLWRQLQVLHALREPRAVLQRHHGELMDVAICLTAHEKGAARRPILQVIDEYSDVLATLAEF